MKTTDNIQQTTEQLEGKLFSRFGAEMPFTVPDGYFDSLSGRVMQQIRARKRRRIVARWAVAAMLAGCVAIGGMLFERQEDKLTANAENVQYIEDALDYTMIDNMSIASYLTEAE